MCCYNREEGTEKSALSSCFAVQIYLLYFKRARKKCKKNNFWLILCGFHQWRLQNGAAKDGCNWDMKDGQAWLLLKQEDGERGRWDEDGAAGANYSLLGIAEVVKSGYLCTRKNENISNYE